MAARTTTLKTLRLYTSAYTQYPWLATGLLLLGIGPVFQNIVSPLFVAKLVGQLASHAPVNYRYIWLAAVSLVGGTALSFLGDRFGSMPLTVRIMHGLYAKALNRILLQDYDFFANSFAGSLVTQANRLAKGYETFLNVVFLDMFGVWCGIVTALVIMCFYNLALGISVAVLWSISIAVVMLLVRKRIPIRRHAVTQESKLTGELADIITNAVTIKTFARERTEEQRYKRSNTELSRRFFHSWSLAISNHLIIQLLCILLQLVVLVGGIVGVQHGSLSIATFLLFQVYILRIIDSVSKASLQMRQLEGVFGDAAEMTELLDRVPAVLDPVKPAKATIHKGLIELSAVQFTYHPGKQAEETLFRQLDLRIEPGERVGLVGPSGGGKSTITRLLLRFMDIQGGTVAIDGQDIRSIRQDDLHRAISYVPQEPLLFHRTLLENISYGNPRASKQEVVQAAKRAHADGFINTLPDSYDTLVGERGIKLSGGQRQRVAIARAILKNAPILILDEATSALDSESEKYIQEALWELMDGKTSVVIAHRLSTIQHLDRIIVLDKGRIIEQGSHQELLQAKGMYAKLWAHQSGGFIEE